jgi:hypothetical protein
MLRHETAVLAKRLRGLRRLPAAVLVLQGLREVPVVERGERFDARSLELVNQAAIEVGQEMENRYAFAPRSFMTFTSSL